MSCPSPSYLFAQCFLFDSYIHRIDIEGYLFMYTYVYTMYIFPAFDDTSRLFYVHTYTNHTTFSKRTPKKDHALLFRFGPGVLWCSWNLSKEQRRKPCRKALPGCRHGVCGCLWRGLGSHIFHDFHLKLQNCWMLNFWTFCDFELALQAIDPYYLIIYNYIYAYAWQIMSI